MPGRAGQRRRRVGRAAAPGDVLIRPDQREVPTSTCRLATFSLLRVYRKTAW
jgi:hypothetical protein